MTIVEFLLACIAEDEEIAHAAVSSQMDEGWELASDEYRRRTGSYGYALIPHIGVIYEQVQGWHVERWDPWRVLAECAAKRAILSEHAQRTWVRACQICGGTESASVGCMAPESMTNCAACGDRYGEGNYCATVRHLTLPYADHPDYNPAWGEVSV